MPIRKKTQRRESGEIRHRKRSGEITEKMISRRAYEISISGRGTPEEHRAQATRELRGPTLVLHPSTLTALIGGQTVEFPTVESKFHALAERWRDHNLGRAVTDYGDLSYLQIIGMGPVVIPLLLENLRTDMGNWIFALKCITGEQAEPVTKPVNPEYIIDLWLEWGQRNGFIEDKRQA